MTDKASTRSTSRALTSIENIKLLATLMLNSIRDNPSEKVLKWVTNEIISNAERAEKDISKFDA